MACQLPSLRVVEDILVNALCAHTNQLWLELGYQQEERVIVTLHFHPIGLQIYIVYFRYSVIDKDSGEEYLFFCWRLKPMG